MPQVNGKEYPYTPEGIKEAAKQRMSDQDRLNAINILLGTEDATEPQPDFEADLAEDDLARIQAENVLMQQMPSQSYLGNPTSRDFADPEIDKALSRQRKERIFGY